MYEPFLKTIDQDIQKIIGHVGPIYEKRKQMMEKY